MSKLPSMLLSPLLAMTSAFFPGALSAQTNAVAPEKLTLEAAMNLAAENQVDIEQQRSSVERSREQQESARGAYRPQGKATGRVQQIDNDRAEASGRGIAERDSRIGLSVSQVIYDEAVGARVKTARHATRQGMHEEERIRLDAMEQAGAGFLRFSLAYALRDIQSNNLKSTRDHLDLARKRLEAGATGQDEVLRWEAEEARQEGNLVSAEADIEKARVALNRTMGSDAETTWLPEPVTLKEGAYNFLDEANVPAMLGLDRNTPQFREFSVLRALDRAPELKAIDEAIAAQRVVIDQRRRGGYVPQVAATLMYDRLLDQRFVGEDFSSRFAKAGLPVASSDADDNEWVLALTASVPLFEGGARKHDVAADEAQLDVLELARVKASQGIEQRVHAAAYGLQASHRRIALAQVAADRARKSYRIVSEKYDRGATPIIDVFDAQSQVLREDIGEAVARNAYLQDLLEYQRSIAWFVAFATDDQRAAWIDHLKRYLDLPRPEKHDEH